MTISLLQSAWASMCKHVAAVLYGIGARLDHQPELLFTLRKVDQQDLIARAGSDLSKPREGPASAKVLARDDLSEMFGIEMALATPLKRAAAGTLATKPSAAAGPEASSKQTKLTRPAKPKPSAPSRARKRLTLASRQAASARMKEYWAARRASRKKRKASESP